MTASEREFTAFYDATWARTVACLYAVTGEWSAAQEAAQEAYVIAWRRWSTLSTSEDPAAVVRQVAVRRATGGSRRSRTLRLFGAAPHPAEPGRPPDESSVAIVTALHDVPEVERRALVLRYLADFSVADIAAVEHCAEKTITARLSRGLSALVPLLAKDPTGEPSHG